MPGSSSTAPSGRASLIILLRVFPSKAFKIAPPVKLTMAASRRTSKTIATRLATVHRVDFPTSSKALRRVVFRREEEDGGGGVEGLLVLLMVMALLLLRVWVRTRLRLGKAGRGRGRRRRCGGDGEVARWGGINAAAVGSDAAAAAAMRRRTRWRGRAETALLR